MAGTPMPPVPGIRDFATLFHFISLHDDAKQWLADARKVTEENKKAARLLGAKEKIEKDLAAAAKTRADADAVIENAKARGESIIDAAEADLAEREAEIASDVERLKGEKTAFADKKSKAEGALLDRVNAAVARDASLNVRDVAVVKREGAAKAWETRLEAREKALRKAKSEVDEIKRKARELGA